MRVLLLTHSFWPDASPPQRRWGAFTRVFAAAGHEVDVITPQVCDVDHVKCASGQAPPDGVRVHRYRSIHKPHTMAGKLVKHVLDAISSVPRALRTPKPDVVIATVPAIPTLVVGFLVSRLRRVPFVLDLRDAWPDLLKDSQVLRGLWLEPVVSRVLKYMIDRSDLVVTVTQGFARRLASSGTRKTATVSNGVEVEKYETDLRPVPRGDKLRVLYLGNLGRSQGLDLVIRAAGMMKHDVELRIVGQGTEKTRMEWLAAQLGVQVEFRDPVYGPRVLEHYVWADTCLVTLRADWNSFEHTIPSKLYELLLLNRHITGLVKGEAAQMIAGSGAGHIVEQSQEALSRHFRALHSERSLLEIGQAGSEWVRQYASLSALGERYLQEISKLTEPRGSTK
ncbi:glycosyltransferase family 4 protein [Glutamicibacter creatinolyticus]|uniref:glycosyltransferase family 4 protein n=1 Tax=Glutamicibacter creatinolyticus TaxID=162496 RepID=UPI0033FC7571